MGRFRNFKIEFRLSRKELNVLTRKVKKSKLSREEYIRKKLFDKELPSNENMFFIERSNYGDSEN